MGTRIKMSDWDTCLRIAEELKSSKEWDVKVKKDRVECKPSDKDADDKCKIVLAYKEKDDEE